MEQSETRPGRRLVLGFDAGCLTCSELARKIEDAVGEKLEVRSLNDPQVEHWREEAFGDDAPWAPTLIEVKDGPVKAWTGLRMGARLGRALGPLATWRVMQVLGDYDSRPTLDTGEGTRAKGSVSRGQFLKGVGGALIAASILSGNDGFVKRAAAKGWIHPLERVGFKSKERLQGTTRREALSLAAESTDVRNVWDSTTLSAKGAFAVRHTLADGAVLTAVAWTISEKKVLVHYAANRPIGNYTSEATLFGYETGEEIWKEAESVNGRRRSIVATTAGSSERPGGGCGCCRWKWGCVATVASACVGCGSTCATCVGTPAKWACGACLACAFVGCPIGIRRCCKNPCG